MKTPKIVYGKRIKKWVAVADTDKINGKRRIVMKCVCCGATKVVGTDQILNGSIQNCNCEGETPAELPKYKGYACDSRVTMRRRCASGLNVQGFCCYWCPDKDDCDDNCLNSPDRCGCFCLNPKKIEKHSELPPEEKDKKVMACMTETWRGGV